MSPHNKLYLFLFFPPPRCIYKGVYSKYVLTYKLIFKQIVVKMLKISKTISTLRPTLVVLRFGKLVYLRIRITY